jgi:hypothetical protein
MRLLTGLTLIGVSLAQYNPFGNRNNAVPERSFIEIPRMNLDINVTCAGREIVVTIANDYIQRNLEWLDSGNKLSLSDYSCKAVQDSKGNRIIRVRDDFTKCGNRITTESNMNAETGKREIESYKITNKLIHDDAMGNIQREIDLLEFDCVYPATQMTSQFMQPWLKSAAHEETVKDLAGRMMLFKDKNFTSPYMEPPELSLDDELFIQVQLEKPLLTNIDSAQTKIATVMEACWGTPTPDRSGINILNGKYGAELKYYMIKDGCPVGDPSLRILDNGMDLTSAFQIKMFKFIGEELNDVWLHCTVRACNSTIPTNCIPDCEDRGRSKRSTRRNKKKMRKKLWYVSGPHEITTELPIQRLLSQDEIEMRMNDFVGKKPSQNPLEPGTVPFKVMLVVLAVIVALAAVFTITCIYVKRRNALLQKFSGGVAPGAQDVIYANTLAQASASSSSSGSLPTHHKAPLKKY